MSRWEPGALREWATLALILGGSIGLGYLLIIDWTLVAAFLGERPLLVFGLFISSASVLGALVIWTALTDKREPDIYSAQDTRRPWEEVE